MPESSPAAGMPQPLTSFIGRERELVEVGALLARAEVRLVTLTGPGGIGKTRLAIEIARRVAGNGGEVRMVELAQVREAVHVPGAMLAALDDRGTGNRPAVETLLALLRHRELLLVLDNLEHLPDVAPLVAELLRECAAVRILATSRSRLGLGGEHVYRLAPLETAGPATSAPAQQLFLERARLTGASWAEGDPEPDVLAEVCRLLDGLPLAIELAAAWSPVLSPPALRDRLEHRLALLTQAPVDAPDRHRTLATAIAWSEDLLAPEVRTLLHRLAVFSGGFSLEAAEAVAGDGAEVLAGIQTLVEASLLIADHAGPTRFRMLETIREYALGQLAARGESEIVRARHAAWFAGQADRLWKPDDPAGAEAALRALRAEHANLRAAFAWAREHAPETAMRLASGLDWYFTRWGDVVEGRDWLAWCEAASVDRTDALRARILLSAAWLALQQIELDAAEARIREAIAVARRSDAADLEATAVMHLGNVLFCLGRHDEARSVNAEARRRAIAVGDPVLETVVILNEGRTAAALGDLAAAAASLTDALRRHRELGMVFGVTAARYFLAGVVAAQGQHRRAAELYREVITSWRDAGDWVNVARAMEGLAMIPDPALAESAARLFGAAAAIRAHLHHPVDNEDRLPYDRAVHRLRRVLPAAFADAWREGGAWSWDAAAEAAVHHADRVAGDAESPAPGGLSERELEVLRAITAGRTDVEISAALYISPRTVATHVAHIYDKLDVHSRAEAAAWAVRHGIA